MKTMRRCKQGLSEEECNSVLDKNTAGVLALVDEDGPYAVPLSYVYQNHMIYFHCAKTGHKLDAIMYQPNVSFCVIDQDKIVPEKFTTHYRSVIVFGKASIINEVTEKRKAIELIGRKYSLHDEEALQKEIEKDFLNVCLIKLTISNVSGKEAIELTRVKK